MNNKKINIITSFTRSGNTWMRFIIYDLLFNQQQININNSLEIKKKIPDIHNLKISNKQIILDKSLENKQVFLKTHFGFEKLKMMPIDKVIIIIRHPFDVLVSLLNIYEINEKQREDMLNYFCSNYTLPNLKSLQFPSWDQHI
ncbi:sulfotransferase domain-containing protein, partial [Candidatus Pelagibacter sp.]|nr:sulfotransferase domain-containing protein [Candidatus Pelagibacter sp.]MDC0851236.1 sulfotransferase domain-containing protein [Candidatus Pelagibacter sp.]